MASQNNHDQPLDNDKEKERYQIQIDRVHYKVDQDKLTGAELRALVTPPVDPDRDLFEVVLGGTDRKIKDADVVQMRNGLRFFTAPSHQKERYQIQIDRVHYTIDQDKLTGAELRALVTPPVDPDRDLFEVVPGGTDRKIKDADVVQMRNGLRFFTAPSHINPGTQQR